MQGAAAAEADIPEDAHDEFEFEWKTWTRMAKTSPPRSSST